MEQINLKEWYPPTRNWALIQGGVLLLLCLWVVVRIVSTGPVEATPAPMRPKPVASPYLTLTDELGEALTEAFPSEPISAVDRVQVLTELVDAMQDAGLNLISRRVEALPESITPRRQRIHLSVEGPPRAHSLLLHRVLSSTRPIVISGFQCGAGKESAARQMTLTLDLLIDNAR
ncbi:MAG: hypothetical protein AAF581_11390 [Planctomycetota bacterium]